MNEELWEAFVPWTLPDGYRIVGTVDRPDNTTYDLGQNAAGQFRLFRRQVGAYHFYSHCKGAILSDQDLIGFGLTRAQSCESVSGEGMFSALYPSHLIGVPYPRGGSTGG